MLQLGKDDMEDREVAESLPSLNLGFLALHQDGPNCLGGYLVTNEWGRPLEFRVSTTVQPSKVQQILFGRSLTAHVYADVIGKTLIEKTATSAQLILTDRAPALDVRFHVQMPVLWLADDKETSVGPGSIACASGQLMPHPRFAEDGSAIRAMLGRIDPSFDFAEPFGRVREAIAEARKLGLTTRNAA